MVVAVFRKILMTLGKATPYNFFTDCAPSVPLSCSYSWSQFRVTFMYFCHFWCLFVSVYTWIWPLCNIHYIKCIYIWYLLDYMCSHSSGAVVIARDCRRALATDYATPWEPGPRHCAHFKELQISSHCRPFLIFLLGISTTFSLKNCSYRKLLTNSTFW